MRHSRLIEAIKHHSEMSKSKRRSTIMFANTLFKTTDRLFAKALEGEAAVLRALE